MTPRASQPPLFASQPLTVLGIDPGSTLCGWGVVRRDGRSLTRVASGTLRPKRDARFDFRLAVIRHGVLLLLEEHKPGLVGVESPYVPQPKANMSPEEARRLAGMLGGVLMLAQARGAVASAIGESERKLGVQLPIEQLAPSSVKAAVAGNGRAKKPEVADGVRRVLGLGLAKLQEDEADALAVAIAAALTWRTK